MITPYSNIISVTTLSNLLLDTYSGAAAAYSLRKLRTAYTGSAIEVRRTNNDVADIGFTSTGELDTAALLAFTGTGALDTGFVTKWYDQSGNANDATQATAVNQPQIVSSGSVISENGKPAIDFDGINDYFVLTPFSINLSNGFSSFSVNVFQSNNNHRLFSMSTTPNSDFSSAGVTFATRQFIIDSDPSITIASNGDGTQNLNSVISTSNTADYYRDTISQGSDSFSKTNTISPNAASIGIRSDDLTSNALGGLLQEITIYTFNQSSNRTGIFDNINDFYSIY